MAKQDPILERIKKLREDALKEGKPEIIKKAIDKLSSKAKEARKSGSKKTFDRNVDAIKILKGKDIEPGQAGRQFTSTKKDGDIVVKGKKEIIDTKSPVKKIEGTTQHIDNNSVSKRVKGTTQHINDNSVSKRFKGATEHIKTNEVLKRTPIKKFEETLAERAVEGAKKRAIKPELSRLPGIKSVLGGKQKSRLAKLLGNKKVRKAMPTKLAAVAAFTAALANSKDTYASDGVKGVLKSVGKSVEPFIPFIGDSESTGTAEGLDTAIGSGKKLTPEQEAELKRQRSKLR